MIKQEDDHRGQEALAKPICIQTRIAGILKERRRGTICSVGTVNKEGGVEVEVENLLVDNT